jgi:hypothetical protein
MHCVAKMTDQAHRVKIILNHDLFQHFSPTQKVLNRLAELYEVSDSQLKQITEAFGQAFNKGLQVPHQVVTMG